MLVGVCCLRDSPVFRRLRGCLSCPDCVGQAGGSVMGGRLLLGLGSSQRGLCSGRCGCRAGTEGLPSVFNALSQSRLRERCTEGGVAVALSRVRCPGFVSRGGGASLRTGSSWGLGGCAPAPQTQERCAARSQHTCPRCLIPCAVLQIVTSASTDLQDYTYYFVPAPWLSVKLLRLLQCYPPPGDSVQQRPLRRGLLQRVRVRSLVCYL